MADGFVNQQYAARAQQQEQQEQQRFMQMLQMAQQRQYYNDLAANREAEAQLRQQSLAQHERDKKLDFYLKIGNDKSYPLDMRTTMLNKAFEIEMPGYQVNPEHVDSVGATMSNMVKQYNETGQIDPNFSELWDQGMQKGWLTPQSFAGGLPLRQAAEQQQTRQAVETLNPKPPGVAESELYLAANKDNNLQDLQDEAADQYNVTGVSGLMMQPEKPRDYYTEEYNRQMATQGWPEGSPYRLQMLPEEQATVGPAQLSTLSEGARATMDERTARIADFKRHQAIVEGDSTRRMMVDKMTRMLQGNPKAVESLNALAVSKTLGVPIAGVNAEQMYQMHAFNLYEKGEENWDEKDQNFMRAFTAVHPRGKEIDQQIRLGVMQQKLQENETKSARLQQVSDMSVMVALDAQESQNSKELASVHEQIHASPTIPVEELTKLKNKEAALNQQKGLIIESMDQVAQQGLSNLQANHQMVVNQLKISRDQLSRTPSRSLDALNANIAALEREEKHYNNIITTFATYPNKAISQAQADVDQLFEEKNRLHQAALATENTDERKTLLAEWEQKSNMLEERSQYIATAKHQRQIAQTQLTALMEQTTRKGKQMGSAMERFKAKDEIDKEKAAANTFFLNRAGVVGAQQAMQDTAKVYDHFDPKEIMPAWNNLQAAKESQQEVIAQQLYLQSDRSETSLGRISKQTGVLPEKIRKAIPRGGAGGETDFKDYQQAYKSVIDTAARLTGQSGVEFGMTQEGQPHFSMGTIKDPIALAREVENQVNSQTFLPDIVKQALLRSVEKQLKQIKATQQPAPAAAAPSAPATATPAPTQPAQPGALGRLRQKYFGQ